MHHTTRRSRLVTSLAFVGLLSGVGGVARATEIGRDVSISLGKSLASIAPAPSGRQPSRWVTGGEKLAIRKAVDLILADKSWWARRRAFHRLVGRARITPPLAAASPAQREKFIGVIASVIEAAAAARRAGDAGETRRATTEALAAIGWFYRLAGGARPSDSEARNARLGWFYMTTVAAQIANVASGVVAAGAGNDAWGVTSLLGAIVLLFGDVMLMVDAGENQNQFAYALSRPLAVVDIPLEHRAVTKALDAFWYDLEARLAHRDEWAAFVRGQPQRSGGDQIARDVREYLRQLNGGKTLEPACTQLLAPGAVHSPFT